MASAVDSRLAYARLSAVATASRLPTANRGSNNSYTTSWDTTWTSDWVVASSRNQRGIAMRVSRYEDFHRDQPAFFAKLLEFFGVSGVEITALSGDSLERNGLHFRLGEVDEWRRIFSAEQCARATEAIPEELRARFDWLR